MRRIFLPGSALTPASECHYNPSRGALSLDAESGLRMNRILNKAVIATFVASFALLGHCGAQVISTSPLIGTGPGSGSPKFGDTGITQSYLAVYGPANIINLSVPEPTTTGLAVGVGLVSLALVRLGRRAKNGGR